MSMKLNADVSIYVACNPYFYFCRIYILYLMLIFGIGPCRTPYVLTRNFVVRTGLLMLNGY
jgi:hypothetical protein